MKRIALALSTLLAFVALAQAAQSANAVTPSSITGRYLTVTESEWNLEVTLEGDGTATYEFSSWPAGKAGTETRKELVKGRWSINGSSIRVDFPGLGSDKTVLYAATPCLSYKSFGADGCSSGLQPLANSMSSGYSQPLWDCRTFKSPGPK
jgi:hypothetical protein